MKERRTHWLTKTDIKQGYRAKGSRWDAKRKRWRSVTWRRVNYVLFKGLRGRTLGEGELSHLVAMVVKHGDMAHMCEYYKETTEDHEENTEQMISDKALVFSRDREVDPMQVQHGTLWRGCWAVRDLVIQTRPRTKDE